MTLRALPRPIEILLVDDNPADVYLTREILQETKLHNDITEAYDGEQALQMLHREPPYEKTPRPDLILLDLNLPRRDGRDVLEQIKNDPDLKRIPVVILTTSRDERDILRTYNLHANCYVTKPIDLEQFITVVKSIEQFWLSIVLLPAE
jgi:two-component system, chemotaxis family, response regulator Rcp1